MSNTFQSFRLVNEEVKALKLFFSIFYFTLLGMDLFVFFMHKASSGRVSDTVNPSEVSWYYILIFLLLPLSILLMKKFSPFIVKYVFFICFTVFDFGYLVYMYQKVQALGGNFTEVVFLMLVPIFVSKNYFWLVTIGSLVKYTVCGIILQTTDVFFPLVMCSIIAVVAYILLIRFLSYIKSITQVFNELGEKEKLANLGQMATGLAHEIRNPLTSLKGFIKLQQESLMEEKDYSPIMNQEIDRICSIVNDLMILGKPKSTIFQKVNLKEIVNYGLSIAEPFAVGREIGFVKEYESDYIEINGDENQLKQVVINLIKNSIEAITEGGQIKIGIKTVDHHKAVLFIEDNGMGIPKENLTKIAEPFFTTKQDGTGLGLMITNQIIKDHDGEMHIESIEGEGTKISIVFGKYS